MLEWLSRGEISRLITIGSNWNPLRMLVQAIFGKAVMKVLRKTQNF